jgi:hypothetical protein
VLALKTKGNIRLLCFVRRRTDVRAGTANNRIVAASFLGIQGLRFGMPDSLRRAGHRFQISWACLAESEANATASFAQERLLLRVSAAPHANDGAPCHRNP